MQLWDGGLDFSIHPVHGHGRQTGGEAVLDAMQRCTTAICQTKGDAALLLKASKVVFCF